VSTLVVWLVIPQSTGALQGRLSEVQTLRDTQTCFWGIVVWSRSLASLLLTRSRRHESHEDVTSRGLRSNAVSRHGIPAIRTAEPEASTVAISRRMLHSLIWRMWQMHLVQLTEPILFAACAARQHNQSCCWYSRHGPQ